MYSLRVFMKVIVLILLVATVATLGVTIAFADDMSYPTGAEPEVPPVETLPPVNIYVSPSISGNVDDIAFDNEDILRYDYANDMWYTYFNGSNCGLSDVDIEGFDFTIPGDDGISYLVMSFDLPIWIPGLGRVDDSDIVLYRGNCQFELFFDGSEYGLTRDSENINAIGFMPDGRLVISTNGYTSVKGHATGTYIGRGQDLWIFDFTTKLFTFYLDGSDVDLIYKAEIIDGVWIDNIDGHDQNIYLGSFVDFTAVGSTTSLAGDTNDIYGCYPLATGDTTDCYFFPFFDPHTVRYSNSIDSFAIDFGGLVPVQGAALNPVRRSYITEIEPEEEGYDPGGPDVDFDETEIVDIDVSLYLPMIVR